MSMATTTNKERRLLEWLGRASPLLESQIVASALSKQLDVLLRLGYADIGAHPTVKDRGGVPAAAVTITEAGRSALTIYA